MLFYPPDPKREPRAFVAATSRAMGQKRGRAEGSFVRETSAQAVAFYRDLVQNLKPWTAPAPKLRSEPEAVETATVELAVVPAWAGSTATERADGLSAAATSADSTDGLAS